MINRNEISRDEVMSSRANLGGRQVVDDREPQDECRPEQECCGEMEGPRGCCDRRFPSKAREVNIIPVDFGFIVKVGCQTFAIETIDKVATNLASYLKDPDAFEKEWYSTKTLK